MNTRDYDEYVMKRNNRREAIIARNKARRAKQLKRNILTLILTFVLVIGLSIALGSFLSKAQAATDKNEVKCFSSVMVGFGESLDDVIEANYDSNHYTSITEFQEEVYSINSLSDDCDVRPGNYVIMPYYTVLAFN